MLEIAISLIFISIMMPMIFGTKKQVYNQNSDVVFKFDKQFKNFMLIGSVLFISISIVFLLIAIFNDKSDVLIGAIFFSVFSILPSYIFLIAKNKKIIIDNTNIYATNVFDKEKVYLIKDIIKAIENPNNGMKLVFKNGDKVIIDIQMNNYSEIKNILEKHNIKYEDINGNNMPKGW